MGDESLHVALDVNGLFTTRAGTARYVRGLLRGFHELAAPGVTIDEFGWAVPNFEYRQPHRALRTLYREYVWARGVAPWELRRRAIPLLHVTSQLPIAAPAGCRRVCTLLDLVALDFPQKCRPWMRHAARRYYRQVHEAERVICISQFTADRAMALLGIARHRLEVVHLASSFQAGDPQDVPPPFRVPERFFLFVGSLEPGKHLDLLRRVYACAESRGIELAPLCVVGSRWHGVPGEGAPPDHWQYTGHCTDADLAYLYRHALALVFPSRYEGFGLPVVEAMTLGCPVVASPVASIPEVAGEAALLCPHDPDRYLAALQRLQDEPGLRRQLAQAGLTQAARFSWRRCAAETLSVYRDCLRA